MNKHICSISDVKLLINYNKLQLQIQNHHVQHHILSSVDIRTSLVILHLCDIPHLTPHPPKKENKDKVQICVAKATKSIHLGFVEQLLQELYQIITGGSVSSSCI